MVVNLLNTYLSVWFFLFVCLLCFVFNHWATIFKNESIELWWFNRSTNESKKGKMKEYFSDARLNSPRIVGNSCVLAILSSVKNGDDAAIVKSQKDVQSSRVVSTVLKLQAWHRGELQPRRLQNRIRKFRRLAWSISSLCGCNKIWNDRKFWLV